MKITSSMIYRESTEATELYLYANNSSRIYSQIKAVCGALAKKIKKGVYDAQQATAAFYHVATEAAKAYNREFSGCFTVTERWTAAADLLNDYMDDIKEAAGC